MVTFPWRSDAGRIAIGPFIAVLVVAGVAYGAYWALGEYGFLGSSEEDVAQDVEEDSEVVDPRPAWLHETEYELPPLETVAEDDLEPPYHRTAQWVVDLVDETWTPQVLSVGEGDQYTWFSDYQGLYLTSPTDDLFKITELETTSAESVVHWDPDLKVVWAVQVDRFDMDQVVEYDLSTGRATTDFAGNVFSAANVVRGGVANLDFHSELPDGRELWVTHSPQGYVTGVVWRDGETWDGSLVSDQIRRMAQQELGADGGVDGWFDPENARAVYHGVYTDPDTNTLAEEMWVTHDFSGDVLDATAVVPVPRDDCVPVDGPAAGTFEGDRLVADCGGTEYLLDPYGMSEPVER